MSTRRLSNGFVTVGIIVLIAIGGGQVFAESISNSSAPVVVIVSGATETATSTATASPTQTATSTATEEASSTVPVVAQLPDTGNAPQGPAATGVLLMMLTAGILLSLGGFAGSRRSR